MSGVALKQPESQSRNDRRPDPAAGRFDLLRMPVAGRFLRWRWSRVTLQSLMLLVSLVMIGHAFWGPQLAPKNLATLLTWVHFRGLIVLVLLVGGNFFCMSCPFLLPRQFARRFVTPRWNWPRPLRNKWPAALAFVGVLFAYELFDLWSNPWWTGALIVGYFAAAFGVDVLFKRASFCKFVCPIGQFNFLGSTMSPLEVAVRDRQTCVTCRTKDCIRGTFASPGSTDIATTAQRSLPIVQRGCELALFQPRKVGNLDCTFCLDCVYACPHDNVGILSRLPAETLGNGGTRSGLGNLDHRPDLSALSIVFVFGALLNAFAMVSPVYAVEQAVVRLSGLKVEWPILGGLFFAALVIEPLLLLGAAAALTRRLSGSTSTTLKTATTFARCLVPIGFGVWLAHYGFHFFTGALTLIPVTQNALRSSGWALLGEPQWQLGGLPESVVFPIEIGFLGLGLIGSWLVAWQIAARFAPQSAGRAFLPWAFLSLLLFATACWILTQPMDMRGTFLAAMR